MKYPIVLSPKSRPDGFHFRNPTEGERKFLAVDSGTINPICEFVKELLQFRGMDLGVGVFHSPAFLTEGTIVLLHSIG
jgi:hypothetical protein